MLIYLKHRYNILGKIPFDSKDKRFQFSVPLENKPAVIVYLIPNENSVEAFHELEVSKELSGFLESNKYDFGNLRGKLKSELSELSSGSYKAARKLLHLIKYCFYCANLNENLLSFKEAFWSIDKSEWKTKPYLPAIADWYLQAHPDIPLDENTYKAIQYYIDHDFEPFLALRYLHRAKKESNPYDRWIDATTAAEWAIKEFLIRLKPDVKAVLLEVPSPPLYKLYGSVLESYTNERSPKLNELAKGAEVRNKLLHRPQDIHINLQQASDYVHDVEIAIYHLLTLLYRDDPVMKYIYEYLSGTKIKMLKTGKAIVKLGREKAKRSFMNR